jgi:mono/diheme cytochrome c family protein
MLTLRITAAGALIACAAFAGQLVSGDARRGEELFKSQQCVQCHSINGLGGKAAPDLARRIDRNFTPSVMASLMWNHAPTMWAAMKRQNITPPNLSPTEAADLFAFFVSARYFEKPGDAGRGKQAFTSKHCADCHGITDSKAAGAPPVAKWESLADPVVLAQQMWNHGAQMQKAFAERKLGSPSLTAQELTDMLVYLQNLPETRNVARTYSMPHSDNGAQIFQAKGCQGCHVGKNTLEGKLADQSLTGIAAAMWNHQPNMKQPPPQLSADEMRQVLSYIWASQRFRGDGNSARGKRVFADKHCETCHNDPASGAPKLAKGKDAYSDITMVAALWGHGPKMQAMMAQKKIDWPRFTAQQMSDLIAYLNAL